MIATKRGRALEDPELFAAYVGLAAEAREVVAAHVEELTGQLERIVADGVARGEFHVADARAAARAAFDATSRWADPHIDAAFDGVWHLVVRGLEARQ